jgi:hypothetical protein
MNFYETKKSDEFSLFEYHYSLTHNILMTYKGPVDKLALSSMNEFIKSILSHYDKASKKIFKIFVEIAQNISYYSEEKSNFGNSEEATGAGTIALFEFENYFNLFAGNLIKQNEKEFLREKCELINSLNVEGLRKLKREHLELPDSERGGANIGLINAALISENPVGFKFEKVNENSSFFELKIKIDK